MVIDFISSLRSGDFKGVIIGLLVSAFVVFCTLPVHECAHALVATMLGDNTAKLKGRLTLSPMAHVDLMGALMILLVGIGYAKPVPVNARNFKKPKFGMAITALAGPVSNILMAFVFLFFYNLIYFLAPNPNDLHTVLEATTVFLSFAASINISLAVFNFLPIPPLDGSRIAALIIPTKIYFKIMQYERYIIIAVFALTFIFRKQIAELTGFVMTAMGYITALPFMLLGMFF